MTWTAPSPSPSRGYRVSVNSAASEFTSATSHTIQNLSLGSHIFRVESVSNELPSEDVEKMVAMLGKDVK